MKFPLSNIIIKFARHFLPLAGFRMLALLSSFVISAVLARSLGPAEYGGYAFALALFTILQPVAGGGLGTLAVRELANPQNSKDEKTHLIELFFTTTLLLSLVIGSIVSIFTPIIFPENGDLLKLAVLVLPGFVLVETARGILAGQNRVRTGQFVSEVLKPSLYLLAILLLLLMFEKQFSSEQALISFAIISIFVGLLALKLSPTRIKLAVTFTRIKLEALSLLRRSLPFAMISAMQYFNTRVDILSIGYFMANADVGQYQVATKLASFVSVPASLVAVLLAPRFSAAFRQKDTDKLRRLHLLGQVAAISLGLPVFLIFLLAGGDIVSLVFGDGYAGAVKPLILLALAQMIFSAKAASTMVLSMTAFESKVMKVLVVGVIGNTVLNVILIPKFGITGAAAATSCTGIVTSVILGISLYRSGVLSRREQP